MKLTTIALAAGLALSGTFALAQNAANTAGGSSKAGGPAATKTTTGASMDGTTTGIGKGSMRHKKHRKHKKM
jgi:hypothetical protein